MFRKLFLIYKDLSKQMSKQNISVDTNADYDLYDYTVYTPDGRKSSDGFYGVYAQCI